MANDPLFRIAEIGCESDSLRDMAPNAQLGPLFPEGCVGSLVCAVRETFRFICARLFREESLLSEKGRELSLSLSLEKETLA